MLELARKRLKRLGISSSRRIQLMKTELPDFSLPQGKADVVILCFPQILSGPGCQQRYDRNGNQHDEDVEVAKFLATPWNSNPKDRNVTHDAQMLLDSLLRGKVVSSNTHSLLRKGGIFVRVEYAKVKRERLTEFEQYRLAFEEGSLSTAMNGRKAERLFDLISSTFFRSRVMQDVYHQTKDRTDRQGGYSITILKAV